MNSHRIYCTLITVTKEKISAERIKRKLNLNSDRDVAEWFEENYRIAYTFFYNDFFRRRLDIEYLGFVSEETAFEGLGPLRLDFALVTNNLFDMSSLHIHFNFPQLEANFRARDDLTIRTLVTFLNGAYHFVEDARAPTSSLKRLREIQPKRQRKYAFPISRYLYLSVCNLDEDEINRCWETLAANIWRLLYCHREGIDEDIASKTLSKNKWSSTEFFWNFYQPGALVSVSAPYPQETYSQNTEWFLPRVNVSHSDCKIDIAYRPKAEGYESYDLLPEYPPLRYLGLLSLEFAGFVEETLRHLYNELLLIQTGRFKTIKTLYRLSGIEALYYKSKNLESLRLPGSREFASTLISGKLQEDIDENIRDQRTSVLNGLILMLTIMALIIACVQILPTVLKMLPNVVSFFSDIFGWVISQMI